ncbi:SusC/RagA family TonB-linked outer membrane protein [Chitinophaga varians]|uniref:SusC/RagA family TonB-linked outer membrane protein n=1 Tax=Chitinophaga varians TaxID=2202339 RepID=A0A847RTX0_9BACT|nr:SusC/RagA family TonB-linked outer membrane protein [Chitinophaga varians]NLR65304.1 SusC/RagA family TonB-linked outer membrane protein [Chitinophaga varians]
MKNLLLLWLFVASSIVHSYAQTRTITGKVSDGKDGTPIPGVTVSISGSRTGTMTGPDGGYKIAVGDNASLVFSYVGYLSQTVSTSGKSRVDVAMHVDTKGLQEIVVTGVGAATDRRKVAISVESLSGKDLPKVPAASIDQALVGKIAGAQISSVSGQPGQQAQIILRGINSLGGTQPMILLDGVQVNAGSSENGSSGNLSSRLADLDLSNIERVEVVQGAAAATIYGAQGANGVIQLFSKKGSRTGKINVNFSSRASFDDVLKGNFKYLNKHYYPTDAEGYIIDPSGKRIKPDARGIWTQPNRDITPNTVTDKSFKEPTYDHVDQLFRNSAPTYNNSINISGGREGYDFALNLSNLKQQSIINGDYSRTNLSLNVGADILKNLKLRSTTQLITSKNTTGAITGQNNIFSGLGTAMASYPYEDLLFKDSIGNYPFNTSLTDNSVYPYYSFQNRTYEAKTSRIVQGINLNYQPIKYLEIDYKYGIDYYRYDFSDFIHNQEKTLTPGKGIDPFTGKLRYDRDNETTQNSLLTLFVKTDFERDFNMKVPITTTTQFAYDWRKRVYGNVIMEGVGFAPFPPFTMANAASKSNDETREEFVTYGYLVNQRVDYGNLFGISGGVRVDYSSAFGRGTKPFTFGRGDAYFRLGELLKVPSIYELKIRGAYGAAGIQPGVYDRQITLEKGAIGNSNYLILKGTLNNPDLTVETSKETEVGIDFGLELSKGRWFRKIFINPTYWTRKSSNVIRAIDLSPSTGASGILTNALGLKSDGFQFSFDLDVLESKKMYWNFGVKFGKQRSIVDYISNHKPITIGGSGEGQFVLKEGESIGAFFGVTPLTSLDELPATAVKGNYEVGPNGYVVNKTTKSVMFGTENKKIGDPTPKFNMSFNNTLTFNGQLTLSFQLDWVYGGQVYNQTRQWLYADKISSDLEKPVTINGQTGAFVAYYNSLYNTNTTNSVFVEDGSFLRLRDLTLTYRLDKYLTNKFINNAQISLTGRNLFTISSYSGLDPEASARVNNPIRRGIDVYSFPNFRSIQIGVTFGF